MENTYRFAISLIMDEPGIEPEQRMLSFIRQVVLPDTEPVISLLYFESSAQGMVDEELLKHPQRTIEFLEQLTESGLQVIEMDMEIAIAGYLYRIIVIDGEEVDILSNNEMILKEEIVGKFQTQDLNNYLL
jgi:hypothetical protein